MGLINIYANNFKENASGSIREDGGQIVNQSEAKVVQNGSKGVDYDKNTERKTPTDIRITKVEGPFDDKGKLVDKIVLGTFYIYKATPSRKPKKEEVALLKWSVKLDEGARVIINGVASLNILEGEKIIIHLKINQEFEKGKIYAFYQKADESVSVELKLKRVKLPMLIIQSLGRKGKKTIKKNGIKFSSNETALDLLYGDYLENDNGFEKLRKELYNETYGIEKQNNFYNLNSREENATKKSDGIIEKIKEFSKKSNSDLFEIFNNKSESVSKGKLENNIKRMILRMQNNEGGEYSHIDLTNAVLEHENTIKFTKHVKNWTISFLKSNENDIEKLRIIDDTEGIIYNSNFKEKVDKPRFNNNSDTLTGIQIAINDVWSYKIYLTEYYVKNNNPHGKLQFEFYDHFGLDYPDIEKFDYDIFIAWFILQHFRGYKPFITKISFISNF